MVLPVSAANNTKGSPEKGFLPVHRKSDGKKETSGWMCSLAVTGNSTTTDQIKDVVGMTGCVGDETQKNSPKTGEETRLHVAVICFLLLLAVVHRKKAVSLGRPRKKPSDEVMVD